METALFHVEHVEFNPGGDFDREFRLEPPPGAVVMNAQKEHFRVDRDGGLVPFDPRKDLGRHVPWLLCAAAGTMLVVAGIFVFRRRSKRQ
jgi:hypothetical protein